MTCSKDASIDVGQNAQRKVGGNLTDKITGAATLDIGGALTEKIAGSRRSVASAQQLIAPKVKLGTDEINVLTLLTNTLDVIKELATLTANHTHSNAGQSQQASQFNATAQKTVVLSNKYRPLIG